MRRNLKKKEKKIDMNLLKKLMDEKNSRTHAPVAKHLMQVDDLMFFLFSEISPLYVGPQIVGPSESATLPTSQQPCSTTTQNSPTKLKLIN